MTTKKKMTSKKPEPKILTPKESEAKIAYLLKQLEAATLVGKKKAIRRQLRLLSHKGGLNNCPNSQEIREISSTGI